MCQEHFEEAQRIAEAKGAELVWRRPPEASAMAPQSAAEPQDSEALWLRDVAQEGHTTLALCGQFEIHTKQEAQLAVSLLHLVKGRLQELSSRKKLATGPINDQLERARSTFKTPTIAFEACESALKDSLLQRIEELLAMQQKALEEIPDREGALRAAAEAAEEMQIEGISVRETWAWEVEDASKVPPELCCPSDSKIKERIKETDNGAPQVPGVRIWRQRHIAVV